MKRSWAIFLLISALLEAVTFHRNVESMRLEVAASTVEEATQIARTATSCLIQADKLLGYNGVPTKRITIAQSGKADILFEPNQDVLAFLWEIAYAGLKRSAEQFLEEGRKPPERFLGFFASALAFRQMRQIAPMIYHYGPARIQLEQGFLPDAAVLLSSPVDASSPTLFHLYCMYSEMLLTCLDTLNRDNSRQYRMLLVMEAEGRPPLESARFALSSLLPPAITVEGWFHTQAARLLSNIQRTLPSESIADQLKELQVISIARLDSPDTLVTIPLEDAPEAFADFRLDKDALARLQSRYLALLPQAPPLLQPPIGEMANAIGLLMEGKSVPFRRKLADAKWEFQEALVKQQEIEKELDGFAAEHTNVILSYQSMMEIIRRYGGISADLFSDEQ